jgi:hypothetical protein
MAEQDPSVLAASSTAAADVAPIAESSGPTPEVSDSSDGAPESAKPESESTQVTSEGPSGDASPDATETESPDPAEPNAAIEQAAEPTHGDN